MTAEAIDKLRQKLERALVAQEVDKDEVLKISMELDRYIVEYMKGEIPRREGHKDDI